MAQKSAGGNPGGVAHKGGETGSRSGHGGGGKAGSGGRRGGGKGKSASS